MITISIKIKKEDKPIFAGVAKKQMDELIVDSLHTAMMKECLQQIHSKFMSSLHTDSTIRLSLVQAMQFQYILMEYLTLGVYEQANFIKLAEQLKKKTEEKIRVLQ